MKDCPKCQAPMISQYGSFEFICVDCSYRLSTKEEDQKPLIKAQR